MNDLTLFKEAMERYDNNIGEYQRLMSIATDSIRATDGRIWDDNIAQKRIANQQPVLTISKLRKYVGVVSSEMYAGYIPPKARPLGNEATVQIAGIYDNVMKHIDKISSGEAAIVKVFKNMLDGGFGFLRVKTDFVPGDDESFDQDIYIEHIRDRFSVVLDYTADKDFYEDGNFAFVKKMMSKEAFKKEYPDASLEPFKGEAYFDSRRWMSDDEIQVSEYYYKEFDYDTVVAVKIPDNPTKIINLTKTGLNEEQIKANGFEIIKRKRVPRITVKHCVMSGTEILEGPDNIESQYIPVVPFSGMDIFINGKRETRSLVYDSIDPTMQYCYTATSIAEISMLIAKSPFMLDPKQDIIGYEDVWQDAHLKNSVYLPFNRIPGIDNVPRRQPQMELPSALVNERETANRDISDTIGIYEASLGKKSNERSKVAIDARKSSSKDKNFEFFHNGYSGIDYTWKIVVDMIPNYYDTNRIIEVSHDDGESLSVMINQAGIDPNTQDEFIYNNLKQGRYGITTKSSASLVTKRNEQAHHLREIMQYYPPAAQVLLPEWVKIQDWPNAEKISAQLQQTMAAQAQQQEAPKK